MKNISNNKKKGLSSKIENKISIFDLNYNAIDNINESEEFSHTTSISFNNKNSFLYQDDTDFNIYPSKTFKVDNIDKLLKSKAKLRKSAVIPEGTRLISLLNFQKEHDFTKTSQKIKENKNSTIKYITYEDTYLENEVFFPSPSSYPGDYSNNKLSDKFCEDYNNDYYERDIMNNSFSYKVKKEDNNIYLKLTKIKECENVLDIKNNKDPLFLDEKEKIGKNIQFLKGKNENLEINNFTKIKGKNNISNISLNLFIKKIAKDNLRAKYSFLYRTFLEQFSIFLSTAVIIEKIINAFSYFKKETSNEYPELLNLLNNIVSIKFNLIKNNSQIINKLKDFYSQIIKATWLKDYLKEDTSSIYYILFNEGEEIDINFAKYSISPRKKNIIFIKTNVKEEKSKSFIIDNKKNKNNEKVSMKPYFYIFDYTEEEIAISLTSISYKLICNINIEELLNSNFAKKDKLTKSPNVMKLIQRFDKLNLFIIEDICSYDYPKERADSITKWVKIGEMCKNLYNYNDALLINTCFSNYLLKRIVLTWKKVPKSTIKRMNELKKFCSNNLCYLNIRKEIVNRRGRFYIPYLGILLKEIVNIEEKYKYILDNGNINCLKIQKLHMIIEQFFSFKKNPFTKVPLKELDIFDNLNPKSEEQIESMIPKIEPKLIISAGENKKRKTKTDARYYF